MSLLDRAFVKAYSRAHASQPSSAVGSPHLPTKNTAVDSVSSGDSDVVASEVVSATALWSNLPDDSYFRVDVGHSQSVRRSPAKAEPVPKAEPDLQREAVRSPVEMRMDPPHFQRDWKPPVEIESEEALRVRRNQEDAMEFARAKLVALSEAEVTSVQAEPVQAEPVQAEPVSKNVETRPFEPVWEVDAFEFDDTVIALFGDAKLMKSIGVPLDHAVANGLRSILITSAERGAGRTSVAVGIAVSAAAAGLRVALVDVDVNQSGLTAALRLEIQHDWIEAGRIGMPLDEVAVRSIEDQFTVLPIVRSQTKRRCASNEFDRMMLQLQTAFDLVIIDGTPWFDNSASLPHATSIDAAILVVDDRNRDDATLAQIQSDLRAAAVAGLGIVENFI